MTGGLGRLELVLVGFAGGLWASRSSDLVVESLMPMEVNLVCLCKQNTCS